MGSKSDHGSEDGRSDNKSAEGGSFFESQATLAELHPADTVKDPLLRKTFDLWLSLKGDKVMPSRTQIAPRQLKHDLRCIHMYDVLPGGQEFRARLVGTGVFPGLDRDQTGRLISEHPDPGVRLRFATILHHVVETASPVRSLSLRLTGHPLYDMRTEGLWLPLGDANAVEIVLAHSSLAIIEP